MGRRKASTSVALILLVLGLVGVGSVGLSWWSGRSVAEDSRSQMRTATAVVVQSTPCTEPEPHDVVEVTVNGRQVRVPLDGCGHRKGEKVRVSVPVQPAGEFLAQPAASSPESEAADWGVRDRLNAVLFTLAVIAGGGYVLLLRPVRLN